MPAGSLDVVPPHPGYRPATSWVHYTTSCNTQSSAPEDGRNHRSKHVDLIGINNKPLLLHLVGCLHYLYQRRTVKQISKLILLIIYYEIRKMSLLLAWILEIRFLEQYGIS